MPPGMQQKPMVGPTLSRSALVKFNQTRPHQPGRSWPNTSSTGAARVASKGAWYWQDEEAHLSSHHCLDICQMDIGYHIQHVGHPGPKHIKNTFSRMSSEQVRCQHSSNIMSFIHPPSFCWLWSFHLFAKMVYNLIILWMLLNQRSLWHVASGCLCVEPSDASLQKQRPSIFFFSLALWGCQPGVRKGLFLMVFWFEASGPWVKSMVVANDMAVPQVKLQFLVGKDSPAPTGGRIKPSPAKRSRRTDRTPHNAPTAWKRCTPGTEF